jgi:hypothetical protein
MTLQLSVSELGLDIETEKSCNKHQDIRYYDQYSKWTSPKDKSRASLVQQSDCFN